MRITKNDLKEMISTLLTEAEENQIDTGVKQAADVEKAAKKMDTISGLDTLLAKINNRKELEQILLQVLKKTNVKPGDIYTAFVKAAKFAAAEAKKK